MSGLGPPGLLTSGRLWGRSAGENKHRLEVGPGSGGGRRRCPFPVTFQRKQSGTKAAVLVSLAEEGTCIRPSSAVTRALVGARPTACVREWLEGDQLVMEKSEGHDVGFANLGRSMLLLETRLWDRLQVQHPGSWCQVWAPGHVELSQAFPR